MTELRINVADLLHQPGARRSVRLETTLPDFAGSAARLDTGDPVTVDVVFEHVADGIVVHGDVRGTWRASCSRCLRELTQPFGVVVRELYERKPLEGETYLLADDVVDLEPALRDAILPELPTAPLCRDDCLGICGRCGADRNETRCDCAVSEPDPRWAALAELEL
ncbi:MAG: DUF177 domain-containing protein [Acidimicrobiia bacterium]